MVVQPQCEVCRLGLWWKQGGRLREQGLESEWLTGCLSNVASVARGLSGGDGDGRAVGGPRQSWRPRPSYVLFRLMRWVEGGLGREGAVSVSGMDLNLNLGEVR